MADAQDARGLVEDPRVRTSASILAASLVLLGAVGIERLLAARRVVVGDAVERLIPPERLDSRAIAAFGLESDGVRLLYLRAKGQWRCREAFGAVCDSNEVEPFLAQLLETRGSLVSSGRDGVERAELLHEDALRLTLHGSKVLADPARDLLAAVRFAPDRGGSAFAMLEGVDRVLAVDHDPRSRLGTSGRPAPLIDTRILAGSLPSGFAGFQRIFVDGAAGSFELVSTTPSAAGVERTWNLVENDAARPALLWRVGGYVSMWVRLRYDALVDPQSAAALGLDPPHATITLAPSTGAPFEVRISAPDSANRVHVWNRGTNVAAVVRAELLPLLVPSSTEFTREDGGNPWESWLAPR